jgi:AraC-like DNA-binding protein
MSVTEIVFECGFESASHLCREFKRKFGRAPSVFRVRAEPREAAVAYSGCKKS